MFQILLVRFRLHIHFHGPEFEDRKRPASVAQTLLTEEQWPRETSLIQRATTTKTLSQSGKLTKIAVKSMTRFQRGTRSVDVIENVLLKTSCRTSSRVSKAELARESRFCRERLFEQSKAISLSIL